MVNPSKLHVVMFVQKVDASDWLLSFTVDWLYALAKRVETLDVVTLENRADPTIFPANVCIHSLGKERHVGRLAELIAFERIVADVSRHADVLFGHLTPRYTWLAAPWAVLNRVPQCLWYTHRQINPELHLALRCVRWVVTAAPNSFPLPGPKVHVMGHGIDSAFFSPSPTVVPDFPPLVLAVGRLAPIKRHQVLLEAAALLRDRGTAANFAIAGGAVTSDGVTYQAELEARITELGMGERFTLLGALGRDDLLTHYRRATVVTNLSPPGLFDKAALEAFCTARPVLVTSPAFDALLGEYQTLLRLSDPPEPAAVANSLAVLLNQSPSEWTTMGAALRERTVQAHGLDRLMDRLVMLWSDPTTSR